MLKLLKHIVYTKWCRHRWKVHKNVNLWDHNDPNAKYPDSIRQTLICKKCGKITRIDL